MFSRSTVTLVLLLSAGAACGDDEGGASGGGTGGSTSASASDATTSTGSSTTAATTTATGAGGAGGNASDGGGGAGEGGLGGAGGEGGSGEGGAGGAPSCVPGPDTLPPLREAPALLSQTGLYSSLPDLELGPGIEPYAVRFPLWSDGADKERWVHLPDCTTIGTADMNHWEIPVGARFYKEFALDGLRIETRVIHRWGSGPTEWWYATYLWNDDETEATRVVDGVEDARGTTHDVPSEQACFSCHGRLPEQIIGFSAVQLADEALPLALDDLEALGWLSTPAADVSVVEDDPVALAALGVLHANCGHCHNASPQGIFFIEPFDLRLACDDVIVEDTGAFQTAVGVETSGFGAAGFRIAPGDTADSCVSVRMAARGGADQMPPLASELVDVDGLAAVDAWIAALPP